MRASYKAAIFAADLVGFTALIERNPDHAISAVEQSRQLMASIAKRNNGVLVDSAGDFLLAKFSGLEDAFAATGDFFQSIKTIDIVDIEYRVGLDFGSIVESGPNIYGNPVNVAARLQQLAKPGGVAVTNAVLVGLPNDHKHEFRLLGEISLKNVSRRVSVYELKQLQRQSGPQKFALSDASADRPQLYFQGFRPIGKSENAKIFSESLNDELTISLGALSSAILVRNREKVETSGSRYELSGNVRNSDRLRITANLRSLETADLIWSDRFDYGVDASYEAQEEITRRVITAAQINLTDGEWAKIWSDHPTTATARDNFQRGRALESTVDRKSLTLAKGYYRAVLEDDPGFCPAIVALAFCIVDELRLCWSRSRQKSLEEAVGLHRQAEALAPNDLYVQCLSAFLKTWESGPDSACNLMESFLDDHPESPELLGYYAVLLSEADRTEDCIEINLRALSLTPHPPNWIHVNLGWNYLEHDEDQARESFATALSFDPDSVRARLGMAALSAKQGDLVAARRWGKKVLERDRTLKAELWRDPTRYKDKEWIETVGGWLKEAGL